MLKKKTHRTLLRIVAVSLFMTSMLSAQAAFGYEGLDQNVRPFNIRYEATFNGNILLIGNSLLACRPGSIGYAHGTRCEDAQSSPGLELGIDNNNFDMLNIDVDDDPSTFNSSSAVLNLPAGAQVTFAGLYWGAFSSIEDKPANPQRVVVKLRTPGSASYTQLIAEQLDDVLITGQGTAYQGFVDVTQQVNAAGAGSYLVANVTAVQGPGRHAGWALVVAYNNPVEALRNLTIYDGFEFVPDFKPIVIPLSGFLTPATGSVHMTLGIYGSDGDRGSIGDHMLLNSTVISDSVNPADNVFNSTISANGSNVTSRVPAHVNTMSIDVDQLDASNILSNNATTATLTLYPMDEKFLPGLVTFSTLVYQPAIQIETRVNDLNGDQVHPGDTLEYTILLTNTGSIASNGTRLTVTLPAGAIYVPGTLNIADNAGGAVGPQTDVAGDDLGEAGNGVLNMRLGAGADSAAGGSIAYNGTATVSYRVVVAGPITNQVVLSNRSDVVFRSASHATAVLTSTKTLDVIASPKARLLLPIIVNQ